MEFSYVTTSTEAEWNRWEGRNFEVRGGGVSISTERAVTPTRLGFDAIDVDADRDGELYVLRPSGDLYRYVSHRGVTRSLLSASEYDVADPRAICVVGDRVYVLDGDGDQLAVVSNQMQQQVGRIETDLSKPIDVVAGDETIYVLDGGIGDEDGRLLSVKRRGKVEPVVEGLRSPQDVATDDDGTVYVLERTDRGRVVTLVGRGHQGSVGAPQRERTIGSFKDGETGSSFAPTCIEATGRRGLLVAGRVGRTGEQSLFYGELDGEGGLEFEKRHGFDRRCSTLVTERRSSEGHLSFYALAGAGGHVYRLTETERHRPREGGPQYSATLYRRFDVGTEETAWHRATISTDRLPSSTQVRMRYYASDERAELDEGLSSIEGLSTRDARSLRSEGVYGAWDLLERSPERLAELTDRESTDRPERWRDRALERIEGRSSRWRAVDDANPEDTLLDDAVGRYLHVELQLVGRVDASPRVGGFRAYCPRKSYLRYLPEIYKNEDGESSFLEQFLSVFESTFVDVEEELDDVTQLFDPKGVPSEHLSWLAEWLSVETGSNWPEPARRELLVRAPELFRKRGTKAAMREMLRLYLAHVEAPDTDWMIEWEKQRLRTRALEGNSDAGTVEAQCDALEKLATGDRGEHLLFFFEHRDLDSVEREPASEPFERHVQGTQSFTTFVGPFRRSQHRREVERIVHSQKPAHVEGTVVPLEHHVELDGNTFLGVNSTLRTRDFTLGRSVLGGDTVLGGDSEGGPEKN